jgi:hypothetical protein
MSYIGQTLGQGKASRSNFTASGGETAVTVENGYQVGQLSVYLNGVKLVDTGDFGATNGTTITGLSPALVAGDIIEFVALDTFSISSQDAAIDLKAPLASPVLVTPNLGTPSAGVMTNTTGIPAAQVSGVLPVGVTGGSGLTTLGTVTSGTIGGSSVIDTSGAITTTGNVFAASSVGAIALTQHHTDTQSGTYTWPAGQLSKGDAVDYAFDSTNKGLTIKKTGRYLIMFHQNWCTVNTTGRMDTAISIVGGGSVAHTIHQLASGMTSYQSRPVWGFYEVTSAPITVYATQSTTFTVTYFWHGCGELVAYRLN